MKRQYYLDHAKCSAILFMIAVHVLWKLGCEFTDPVGYTVNFFLGGFMAAPIFMVAMGMGFAFTKKCEPEDYIHRGFVTLLLGYALNVLRELPLAVFCFIREGMTFASHELWYEFLQGDILQFAGLAMILFGVLKIPQLSDKTILLISCAMSLTGYVIPVISSDSIAMNATTGLFVFVDHSEETMMCFPLFTWFIYPAFGYWFERKFEQTENPDAVFRKAILPCFLIASCASLLEMRLDVFMMRSNSEYYHMQSHDVLISLCYTVFCFSAFYYICRRLPEKVNRFFASIGNALNLIYLIHWPLIYLCELCMVKICNIEFTYLCGFATTAVITCVSVFFAVRLKETFGNRLKQDPNSILRFFG